MGRRSVAVRMVEREDERQDEAPVDHSSMIPLWHVHMFAAQSLTESSGTFPSVIADNPRRSGSLWIAS